MYIFISLFNKLCCTFYGIGTYSISTYSASIKTYDIRSLDMKYLLLLSADHLTLKETLALNDSDALPTNSALLFINMHLIHNGLTVAKAQCLYNTYVST